MHRMGSSQAPSIVGTWKLLSVRSTSSSGEVNEAEYGLHPSGFLTYTSAGRMCVVIAEDGRELLSVDDKVSAPALERARAFSTFSAYAGRYTFAGSKVVHHIEVASTPNWVRRDVLRFCQLEGDRLALRTPPMSRGGAMLTLELRWQRIE